MGKYLSKSSAVLLLVSIIITLGTTIAVPRCASGQDNIELIHTAISQDNGDRYIKIFDSTGQFIESIPISSTYKYAQFLASNWTSETSSIAAIYQNENDIYQASILDDKGALIVRIRLGKDVFRVLGLDYDGSGFADLAVQHDKGPVKVYLDPGNNGTTLLEVSIPRFTDIVKIPGTGQDLLGVLKLKDPNQKRKKKKKKKKKKKSYLQYNDRVGNTVKINITGQPKEVKAFRTPQNNVALAALYGKKIKIFSYSTPEVKSYSIPKGTTVLTSNYKDDYYGSLLIGNINGDVNLNHPFNTSADVSVTIDKDKIDEGDEGWSDNPDGDDNPGNPNLCDEIQEKFAEYYGYLISGNMAEAKKIEAYLNSLGSKVQECLSGGFNQEPPSSNPKESLFSDYEVNYVSNSVVSYHSNTGERMGPCDTFLPAPDGPGGFLAKNSDHGGIVYLTKYGYSNGRILHHKSFKLKLETRYSGVANGGRGHFRTGGSLPKGPHIFAADRYGETHCWRIPDGMSRVD